MSNDKVAIGKVVRSESIRFDPYDHSFKCWCKRKMSYTEFYNVKKWNIYVCRSGGCTVNLHEAYGSFMGRCIPF